MVEIKVTNINEFHQAIKRVKLNFNTSWFRGLTDIDYELVPSIYRNPYSSDKELNFLGKFKSHSIPFLDHIPQNDWEWLFLMQHYGVPTRLMDWSESPLVALTFALKNVKDGIENKKDSIIYCLNPIELNQKVSGHNFRDSDPIPFIGEDLLHMYGVGQNKKNNLPIAIIGPLNNHRIIAQKGTFTLFPHSIESGFTTHNSTKDFLSKIILNKECLSDLKEDLYNLGITYESLFPGLDSISKDIINTYRR